MKSYEAAEDFKENISKEKFSIYNYSRKCGDRALLPTIVRGSKEPSRGIWIRAVTYLTLAIMVRQTSYISFAYRR